ncbi:V4R domain-containing protein [Acaryochloris sp. IP29b_bin.148]|uniref:V4R domain-containing protein n=1 Tax=Acaryochloris sp. IP29b_bin.148 TaxID=2969218 RepID=UPI00260C39CB|nr:V4R domain-containing protein [Acaryochloris sp. IP29b_bin.148]
MIAVEELTSQKHIPGNFFAPNVYVQGDTELGLIENREGARLIALPETLLSALYSGLEHEVGPAADLVLQQCGYYWGRNFYRRFASEVSEYYGKSLAEMEMVEFLQLLKACWKTYGWGLIELDFSYHQQGFLVVQTQHSAFAKVRGAGEHPSCFVESGLLSAFFSQLTGRELGCVQTTCESLQATHNSFILGLPERIKAAEAWIKEAQDHDTILSQLCSQPAATVS